MKDSFNDLIPEIALYIQHHINPIFPDASKWFITTVVPQVIKKTCVYDGYVLLDKASGDIVGAGISKDTRVRKKICLLHINPKYRKKGHGLRMIIRLCKTLRTVDPEIEIPLEALDLWKGLIRICGWISTGMDHSPEGTPVVTFNRK